MGRFDVTLLRYLTSEDFRVLTAVELGMRNHELVPNRLIAVIANLRHGGVHKVLRELAKNRLVSLEKWKRVQGYRLTNLGYDYLALKSLACRDVVVSVGRQIGVGKESDIFVALDANGDEVVIKFHRLGRTSFRKVREKRDYLPNKRKVNWLYFSRLAALKEFSFMSALHKHDFSVPAALANCRHAVVMQLMPGYVLNQIHELDDPAKVYDELMNIIVRLASMGLIHGDFNEFNIMLSDEDEVFVIDFPQMVSTEHANARSLFERDVNCIKTFFRKRYNYETEDFPEFDQIERESKLDEEVAASGFSNELEDELRFLNLADQKEISDDEDESEEEDDLSDVGEESNDDVDESNNISEKLCDTNTEQDKSTQESLQSTEPTNSGLSHRLVNSGSTIDPSEAQRIEQELAENYERLYQPHISKDEFPRTRKDSEQSRVSRVSSSGASYVSTTIPPSLIKQKVRSQSAKAQKMEMCKRAIRQGESSLKTKEKQDRSLDIRTSLGPDWYG
jgi:RIO kinase 2